MEFLLDKSDEQIVILARERNPEYFGDLVTRYQQRIFGFIRSIIRHDQVAEDLTQQAFEKAFTALNSFNAKLSFKTWLFTIAKNETFSYIRYQKRHKTVPLVSQNSDGEEINLEETVPNKSLSPMDELSKKQDTSRLKKAFDQLKPKYKAVLSLYYLEDLSYKEIAQALNIRLNTVRTHIRRAKADLAEIISNETF